MPPKHGKDSRAKASTSRSEASSSSVAATAAAPRSRRRARSQAGSAAAASSSGLPPLVEATPTLPLQTTLSTSFVLQHALFFASSAWVRALRTDVHELLSAFEQAYTSATRGDGSPFETFKSVWVERGWSKIHLFGVMDGRARQTWGASILRAFLEHLSPESESSSLAQVGALFAIYTFFNTQADTQEQIYIRVDPPTLEHFLTLTNRLAPSLDTSATSSSNTTSPTPSLDLHHVLLSLLDSQAFHLIPTEAYLHPRDLPNVHAVPYDPNLAQKKMKRNESVKLMLGIEAELKRGGGGGRRSTHNGQVDEPKESYLSLKQELAGGSEEPVVEMVLNRAKRTTWQNLVGRMGVGIETADGSTDELGEEGRNLLRLIKDEQ